MESLQARLQREAREKLRPEVTNIDPRFDVARDFAEELLNVFWVEQQKDLDAIISHTISETIKAERAEWLRSEIEELEKRKFNVVDWLRNTYGLDDDDCLSAGRVQELCEMLVPDAFTSIITRYKEELKVLTGEYE